MRVLLLTPLHESSEHIAMNLMTKCWHTVLAEEQGYDALSVPNYADYLLQTGIAPNFEASIFMALREIIDWAEVRSNCIVIGNAPKKVPFDIILGVNINHEEGVPLVDLQVEKLKELYGDDPDLGPLINDLYSVDDAEYHAGGSIDQIVELVVNLCQAKKASS